MTPLIINIFLFIIGLIIFFKKPNNVPIYYSIWTLFGCYLTDILIFNVIYQDYGVFPKYANIYIVVVFILMCISRKIKLKEDNGILLKTCFLFCLYVLFLGFARDTLSSFGVWIFNSFSWLLLYLIIENLSISNSIITKYIRNVLIIEIIVCSIQLLGYGHASFSDTVANFTTFSGTLFRYNFAASLLCVLSISLTSFMINDKRYRKSLNYVLIIIAAVYITLSGARTELIAFVLCIGLILFFNNRKSRIYFISFITTLGIIYLIYGNLISVEQTADYGADATQRQINILNIFTDPEYLLESSTFGLSFRVLYFMNYDLISLLFGSGLFYTTQTGYGGVSMESGMLTDATLAIYVAETGIIGVIFLVRFLKLFYKSMILKVFIIYFIIVTITDMGIFQASDVIFMLLTIKYFNNINTNSTKSYDTLTNYSSL